MDARTCMHPDAHAEAHTPARDRWHEQPCWVSMRAHLAIVLANALAGRALGGRAMLLHHVLHIQLTCGHHRVPEHARARCWQVWFHGLGFRAPAMCGTMQVRRQQTQSSLPGLPLPAAHHEAAFTLSPEQLCTDRPCTALLVAQTRAQLHAAFPAWLQRPCSSWRCLCRLGTHSCALPLWQPILH